MSTTSTNIPRRLYQRAGEAARRFHRNQRGTISIVTVFAVLLLTMLLGMVMNVGRHTDGKIRLQNSADASAYSGGLVLTRGMNTLAFTNHLLSDVFALTAFMREARDRNSEMYTGDILAAWNTAGDLLIESGFPKFVRLGDAIHVKVAQEEELIRSFGNWAAASSDQILPVLEEILAMEMIPEFQRALVVTYPDIAQQAALEVASRNGQPDRGRGRMLGVLWRTDALPVGGALEYYDPTLPVIDPVLGSPWSDTSYLGRARRERRRYAEMYLGVGGYSPQWRWYDGNWHARSWNDEALVFFDREAKMSQFSALWRSFTCGYLEQLLEEEYPSSNLPHLIQPPTGFAPRPPWWLGCDPPRPANEYLEENFTFLGLTYWRKLPESLPGLFRNPMDNDDVAYAEVRMFIPRRRLHWYVWRPTGSRPDPMGSIGGQFPELPGGTSGTPGGGAARWRVGRQSVPIAWNLFNQHWTCQLVPATQDCLATVLQTPPLVPEFAEEDIQLPNLGEASSDDLQRISPH